MKFFYDIKIVYIKGTFNFFSKSIIRISIVGHDDESAFRKKMDLNRS